MHNNSTHIRRDSSEDEYQQQLLAAQAQSGMFKLMNEGANSMVKESRDPKYGVPRMPYGEIAEGRRGGFSQGDGEIALGQPFNAPMTRNAQTGNLATGTSSTEYPEVNPELFAENAAQRMARIAEGKQGFNGYNDRNRRA